MADAVTVLVRRGGATESRHRVHAVAVREGEVVEAAGDAELVTFMRSAAKPLQALPLARAAAELPAEELAIACASHLASEEQLAAARSLLARAGAREDELACGPEGRPPGRLRHNCSGKHAGMLLLCRRRGWDPAGYHEAAHPLQRALLVEVAAAAGMEPSELGTAVDGCGVVTFSLPLRRMAHAFGCLERLDGGRRVAAAMRAHPRLIRGPGAPDTRLMELRQGWIAKGGAEGVLCAAGPGGLGVALKVEDGAGRALAPALAAFLARLGTPVAELGAVALTNSRGERVGELVTKE